MISYKPLVLGMLDSTAFTVHTFTSVEVVMLMIVQSAKLVCQCMYQMIICRVSQEECAKLREGVPYVKVYRYNPKHLCPKLNGYRYNGQRSLKL